MMKGFQMVSSNYPMTSDARFPRKVRTGFSGECYQQMARVAIDYFGGKGSDLVRGGDPGLHETEGGRRTMSKYPGSLRAPEVES